jgi:dsDNA-specific endonuclease/ATPase MutS2
MNHTFQILEFDKILKQLEELANTEAGKQAARQLEPFMYEGDVRRGLFDTSEARIIIDNIGQPPAVSMTGIDQILKTAEQGGCLSEEELETAGIVLTGVKRFKDFLIRCKYLELSLPYYGDDLNPLDELRETLAQSVRSGRVEDSASKLLRNLRQDIVRMEEKIRTKADNILRGNKQYFADSYVTIRNGRICLPVKKEYKSTVGGTVIDQSQTGSTLFMEPAAISALNEELEILQIEEENETRRILYELTGMIDAEREVFEADKKLLEKLDFLFAKGKLSADMESVEPMVNTDRVITIVEGKHPLMNRDTVVPLSFNLGKTEKGIVITGPNTGGKTVSIKTVGLFCLMAQCGLHVPCTSANLCMNDRILCDIGDGQNITANLSTFSAHITNVLDILDKAGPDSLVILDELGSGTDPAEGMGIAVAILEELKQLGCLFLATTHYPEVKVYAQQTEGMTNARMAFDRESLKPLYRLEIGEAGESCALYIAKRLGMSDRMIARAARAAYNEGEAELEIQKTLDHRPVRKSGIVKQKHKASAANELKEKFSLGDSVTVFPDNKTGIVCKSVNEKGVLQVQLPDKKIWINHKRVKLKVAAAELYPDDYDFSIIFDTVENRKARHQMDRKYQEGVVIQMDRE